jgi:hypothetical protein
MQHTINQKRARMALAMQRCSRLEGVRAELLPGVFSGSDLQLILECDGGIRLSILPDADLGALYELVRLDHADGMRLVAEKLSLDALVQAITKVINDDRIARVHR